MDPAAPELPCPSCSQKFVGRIFLRCHNGDGWVAFKINSYHSNGYRGSPCNFYVTVYIGVLKRPKFEQGFVLKPEEYVTTTEKTAKAGPWMLLKSRK
jgi:hypothetical protein